MSFTMEDNLEESGWVAVRLNAFEEKEKHKFVFIVTWNEVEGKCAITCHNRTAQRRSMVGRDSVLLMVMEPEEEESTKTKWPKTSPAREKAAVVLLGSPGRNNKEATVIEGVNSSPNKAIKSPPSSIKTTPSPPPAAADKWAATGGSSSSCHPRSSLSPAAVSPAEDMEVLEPLKEDHDSLLSVETLELEEVDVMDASRLCWQQGEDCSWAGLFSFQDLRAVHLQLCQVNSDLEPCLPAFPEESGLGSGGGSGVWSALFGSTEVPESEMDELCYRLQLYLGHALDTCGWKILSGVLFTESDDPEEYYESLSELRQSGYEEVLGRAKKHLQELLEKHRSMESMVDLLQVYEEEDSAYSDLLEASTQLYQFLLQPFRDMRELAMLCRQQIKISMDNDHMGPRRIEALKKEDSDWQKKAQEAVLNIQEFTVQYFEITAKAQKAVYERMRVDQRRLGRSAWSAAVQRMERLRYTFAKETLQLQRARELCLEQRKHALREQMQSLCSGEGAMARLDHMEAQYYELQLRLYDIQAEILQCEELLLTAQLDSIRRQMSELRDEVVYYDTYESPEAIVVREEGEEAEREELRRLQQSVRHLEARRGRITTKRSYLKSKREICVSNNTDKQLERQASQKDSTSQHASLQQRGEEEEDEEKKNSRVSEERQRTLDRLRTFKQHNPGQVILKSARLRVAPHARRRERERNREGGWGRRRSGEVGGETTGGWSGGRRRGDSSSRRQSASVQTEPCGPPLPPPTLCTTQPRVGVAQRYGPPPALDVSASPHAESSCSPCSLPSLLGPPPPPPPPPPQQQQQPTREEALFPSLPPSSYSPGEDSARAVEREPPPSSSSSLSPLGPFVPRFFDSSQLVSARMKLRKVPELDGHSRRVSSPMDEVLASLKRGSFHLRKVEQRPLPGGVGKDGDDGLEDGDPGSILAQIRRGVKLRRVPQRERRGPGGTAPRPPSSCTDPLTLSIHEALRRIKEASPDSDSDDDDASSSSCPDWES